jgi:hypothetical protein
MTLALDAELERLLVGTNEQRRRVGQALWHLHKTLAFWHSRGRTFSSIARAWCAAGGAIFSSMAATLRRLGRPEADARLRAFVAEVLQQLADDLERGEHMLVPFLRWMDERFPVLTAMMREESAATRVYDSELATLLADTFRLCSAGAAPDVVRRLREGAAGVRG